MSKMPNFPALFKLFLNFLRNPLCIFISVKGVVIDDGKVWLRLNEIKRWELPGGRMEPGEQPEQTLVREVYEELGFTVKPVQLIRTYMTHGFWINKALLVIFTTELTGKPGKFELQGEFGKAEFKAFTLAELEELNLSAVYHEAILQAFNASHA